MPLQFSHLLRGRSLQRIRYQQGADETLRILRNVLPVVPIELKIPIHHHAQGCKLVCLWKRRVSAQSVLQPTPSPIQNEGDHSQRPHVHCRTIALTANNLWSSVSRSAAERLQPLIAVRLPLTSYRSSHVRRKAEVGNSDVQEIVRRLEQNVLRFQITVNNVPLVAIAQRVQQRSHQILCLTFTVALSLADRLK